MGLEYKIKFAVPGSYSTAALNKRMPAEAGAGGHGCIYAYAVESDGFYFVDTLVNKEVASVALRVLVDEALRYSPSVQVTEL